ncbi:MAG: chemotaxis protein CheW [Mariniblastus sp.]
MSEPNSSRESYCTFRLGSLNLGVEVSNVQEVLRYQPTTRVPLTSSVVHGLMNLRGQIVTALDLRSRLGLPKSESENPLMNVVIRSPDGPVSLLVDEIGDVVEVDQQRFEPPPETLQGAHREFIRGTMKMDDELLLLLDTASVLRVDAA